jgi:hypothetical protein
MQSLFSPTVFAYSFAPSFLFATFRRLHQVKTVTVEQCDGSLTNLTSRPNLGSDARLADEFAEPARQIG